MNKLTPVKAIRKFCIRCQSESLKGVRFCDDIDCELYPYRMGKNPKRIDAGKKRAQAASFFSQKYQFSKKST